jgi:hypothetical protein
MVLNYPLKLSTKDLLEIMTSWGWFGKCPISKLKYEEWKVEFDYVNSLSWVKALNPTFCVYTIKQRETLETIFREIYEELKDTITNLKTDIEKTVNKYTPKRLSHKSNVLFLTYIFRYIFMTTAFAYYDGKLYIPDDINEFASLPLVVTVHNV